MEKIDHKFLEKLHFFWGPRVASPLVSLCDSLELDEMLFVSKEEWKKLGYKTRPKVKLHGKSIRVKSCAEGWVLIRIK